MRAPFSCPGHTSTKQGYLSNQGVASALPLNVCSFVCTMASTPLKDYNPSTDGAVDVLGKICRAIFAVIRGDVGFLVRGSLTTTAGGAPFTAAGGTITEGGTSQALLAANADRRYLFVQNISATEVLGIGIGVAATTDTPSVLVGPGGTWEPPVAPTQALEVVAATTGTKFSVFEA